MATLRQGRVWLAMAGLAGAAGYGALAAQVPLGTIDLPGPGIFPLLLAPLIGLFALGVLLEARRADAVALDLPQGGDAARLLAVTAALVAYLVLLPWLGHMVSASLLAGITVRLLRRVPVWQAAGWGLGIGAGSFLIFARLLQVPLPRGVLLQALGG